MLKYIGIVCFAALFLMSCKKEQPQMTPLNQECDCAKEVSAEFTMEEINCNQCPETQSTKFYTNTDSIYANKAVRFTALEENAEYTWHIGTEVISSKSVIRFFPESLSYSNLPISLVVKKKPNKICFPADDGYDSLTKTLGVLGYYPDLDTFYLEGIYRFKSNHLTDSFDVMVDYIKGQPFTGSDYYFTVYNFDGNGTNSLLSGNNWAYINFRECLSFGSEITGKLKNDLNGLATFNFTYKENNNSPYFKYNYKGRKL